MLAQAGRSAAALGVALTLQWKAVLKPGRGARLWAELVSRPGVPGRVVVAVECPSKTGIAELELAP